MGARPLRCRRARRSRWCDASFSLSGLRTGDRSGSRTISATDLPSIRTHGFRPIELNRVSRIGPCSNFLCEVSASGRRPVNVMKGPDQKRSG